MMIFDQLVKWVGIAICLGVLLSCICRIDLLDPKQHSRLWPLVYIAFAVYAAGVMLDLWIVSQVDWYEAAGVFGVLLLIALTRESWRHSPPGVTARPPNRS